MLIRFTVENFLSFNDRVEFNMIASDNDQSHSHHIIREENDTESIGVLRTSIIYGANASGKSNLVKAMEFAKDFIVQGVDKNKNIKINHFKLNKASSSKPSRFEFEFKHNSKQYAYGFVVDKAKVHEEWLYEIGLKKEEVIYERNRKNYHFNFESNLLINLPEEERARINFEAKSTRDNLLFLTNCKERNIEYFEDAYQWFSDVLIIIYPQSKPFALPLFIREVPQIQELFTQILKVMDLGISKIDYNSTDLVKSDDISEEIKSHIQEIFPYDDEDANAISIPQINSIIFQNEEQSQDLQIVNLATIKLDSEENEVRFKIKEESDGTQRIIDLVPMLINTFQGDTVVVIDEIESSLHVLLTKKLFEIFLNLKGQENQPWPNSQLIATTHQIYLLDIKELFRKDEIWFVQKDKSGQSKAYSLANTDVEDLDLVKGYINGRFGAIPFLKDIQEMGWLTSKESASPGSKE